MEIEMSDVNIKKYIQYFISLLLLINLSFSFPIAEKIELTIHWYVNTNDPSDCNLSVLIPNNSTNQKVISMNFSERVEVEKENENLIAKFVLKDVKNKEIIGNFLIEEDYSIIGMGGDKINGEYLSETKYIKINKEITDLSNNLASEDEIAIFQYQKL